jgi:hypothetical protein
LDKKEKFHVKNFNKFSSKFHGKNNKRIKTFSKIFFHEIPSMNHLNYFSELLARVLLIL